MKFFQCILPIVAIVLTGCQTIPKPIPLQLPITVQEFFDACMAGDGMSSLQVRGPDIDISSLELEWIGKANREWRWEITNPLGQSMLMASYQQEKQSITMGGQAASRVPPLTVGTDGFLRVDGHFVGVRPDEMSCFLRMKFPQAWLETAYSYTEVDARSLILAGDRERRISIDIEHIQSVLKRRGCASVRWSKMLGLVRSEIKFCIKPGKLPTMTVTGLDDWQLNLKKIED